jgi:PPP family 3-phenylpropionic acid transporter
MRTSSYPQLSSFYFFFFAVLGVFVPYWSLYLKSLEFSAAEIGELIAIVMASKIISPYLLSWFSDHIGKRLIIIQWSMLFSVLIFAGVLPFQSYWWFVSVMAAYGFFWNACLPLFEALTLNHLMGDTSRYSHVRLWGSIGFILMVIALPPLIEGENIARLPLFILALLIAGMVTTFLVKDMPSAVSNIKPVQLTKTLKRPIVIALLIACALQTLSHGAYYTFFTIYLEEHGYSRHLAGWMWALGVFAEVILFVLMRTLLNYFSVYHLFISALFITSVRWVILALWVDNLFLLLLVQLLHAASFGLFHATAIYLTHMLFPGRLQGRGQALYAGMSFGLGGALGHLLSGYSWDTMGSTWAFLSSAIIALIGAMIAAKYVTKERMPVYVRNT